jgi:hypothetical protein
MLLDTLKKLPNLSETRFVVSLLPSSLLRKNRYVYLQDPYALNLDASEEKRASLIG